MLEAILFGLAASSALVIGVLRELIGGRRGGW